MVDSSDALALFPVLKANDHAKITLFCLPHAGGDVISYWPWTRYLSDKFEIRSLALPGKYARIREPAIPSFDAAIDVLSATILPLLHRPFAIFGHSLGALIGYGLSSRLTKMGRPPRHFFASGLKAPHLYNPSLPGPQMTERELVDFLRRMNGTPAEILQNSEAMKSISPALRADLALCRTYAHADIGKLECPITVLAGKDDDYQKYEVEAWKDMTSGAADLHWFDGDHMFIKPRVIEITNLIEKTVFACDAMKHQNDQSYCSSRISDLPFG